MKHEYLQKRAMLYLAKKGYWTVYPECEAGYSCGRIDVVGAKREFNPKRIATIGIEVKVSRSDFFSKKQKSLGEWTKSGYSDHGVNRKYFIVPSGLVSVDEVYEGWGLMVLDQKTNSIRVIKEAPVHEVDNTFVLFEMAQIPVYVYHETKTKLVSQYTWISARDILIEQAEQKDTNEKT